MRRTYILLICLLITPVFCWALPPPGVGDDAVARNIEEKNWRNIKDYVEHGGDLSWKGFRGVPLLVYLIKAHENDIAQLAIEKGALQKLESPSEYARIYRAAVDSNNLQLGQLLLDNIKKLKFSEDPELKFLLLSEAVEAEKFDFIKQMIRAGADINYKDQAILEVALQEDNGLDMFKFFVERGINFDKNAKQRNDLMTAAVRSGNLVAVKYFAEQGLSLKIQTDDGYTLLMFAVDAWRNRVELIRFLLENDLDPCSRYKGKQTAYDFAVESRREDIISNVPQLKCTHE